jgi:hypothetical protein
MMIEKQYAIRSRARRTGYILPRRIVSLFFVSNTKKQRCQPPHTRYVFQKKGMAPEPSADLHHQYLPPPFASNACIIIIGHDTIDRLIINQSHIEPPAAKNRPGLGIK